MTYGKVNFFCLGGHFNFSWVSELKKGLFHSIPHLSRILGASESNAVLFTKGVNDQVYFRSVIEEKFSSYPSVLGIYDHKTQFFSFKYGRYCGACCTYFKRGQMDIIQREEEKLDGLMPAWN